MSDILVDEKEIKRSLDKAQAEKQALLQRQQEAHQVAKVEQKRLVQSELQLAELDQPSAEESQLAQQLTGEGVPTDDEPADRWQQEQEQEQEQERLTDEINQAMDALQQENESLETIQQQLQQQQHDTVSVDSQRKEIKLQLEARQERLAEQYRAGRNHLRVELQALEKAFEQARLKEQQAQQTYDNFDNKNNELQQQISQRQHLVDECELQLRQLDAELRQASRLQEAAAVRAAQQSETAQHRLLQQVEAEASEKSQQLQQQLQHIERAITAHHEQLQLQVQTHHEKLEQFHAQQEYLDSQAKKNRQKLEQELHQAEMLLIDHVQQAKQRSASYISTAEARFAELKHQAKQFAQESASLQQQIQLAQQERAAHITELEQALADTADPEQRQKINLLLQEAYEDDKSQLAAEHEELLALSQREQERLQQQSEDDEKFLAKQTYLHDDNSQEQHESNQALFAAQQAIQEFHAGEKTRLKEAEQQEARFQESYQELLEHAAEQEKDLKRQQNEVERALAEAAKQTKQRLQQLLQAGKKQAETTSMSLQQDNNEHLQALHEKKEQLKQELHDHQYRYFGLLKQQDTLPIQKQKLAESLTLLRTKSSDLKQQILALKKKLQNSVAYFDQKKDQLASQYQEKLDQLPPAVQPEYELAIEERLQQQHQHVTANIKQIQNRLESLQEQQRQLQKTRQHSPVVTEEKKLMPVAVQHYEEKHRRLVKQQHAARQARLAKQRLTEETQEAKQAALQQQEIDNHIAALKAKQQAAQQRAKSKPTLSESVKEIKPVTPPAEDTPSILTEIEKEMQLQDEKKLKEMSPAARQKYEEDQQAFKQIQEKIKHQQAEEGKKSFSDSDDYTTFKRFLEKIAERRGAQQSQAAISEDTGSSTERVPEGTDAGKDNQKEPEKPHEVLTPTSFSKISDEAAIDKQTTENLVRKMAAKREAVKRTLSKPIMPKAEVSKQQDVPLSEALPQPSVSETKAPKHEPPPIKQPSSDTIKAEAQEQPEVPVRHNPPRDQQQEPVLGELASQSDESKNQPLDEKKHSGEQLPDVLMGESEKPLATQDASKKQALEKAEQASVDPSREDIDFIADSKKAVMRESSPWSNSLLYGILLFFVIMLIWASLAQIDERTTAQGKVVPSSQTQVIQNLEGGIVSEILVREGDNVKKGQVLLRIDDTRFASTYREGRQKYLSLLASIARLGAEAKGEEIINFPEVVQQEGQAIIASEQKLFNQQKQEMTSNLKTLQQSYDYAKEELEITKPLVEEGLMSKLELLRLQREVNEIEGNIASQTEEFQSAAQKQLTEKQGELATLSESLLGMEDRMVRTTVRSPVSGSVKKINVTTVGGVIQPGMDIMEIVPAEDTLLVEAKVKPKDIAFIHPGQEALVKVTAYDYSIYGGLEGIVEYISPDTIQEREQDKEEESFYKILVRTDKSHLGRDDNKLFIIPGMTVTVDVLTGKKTVLDYLLKPFLKARDNALRER